MKIKYLLLFVVASVSMASCSFFNNEEEILDKSKLVCYIAIDKGDTAWLSIDTSKKKINGLFTMSYGGIKKYDGQVKGRILGDTLKAHFDFKVNKVDKWYRNPVAFLRKDNKLLMGVGETVLIWGSGHFDEKVPIDFEKGRFVFDLTTCKK